MRLRDKVCIVTGANSGIGQAVTRLFLREGAFVLGADVNTDKMESYVSELDAKGRFAYVTCDVRDYVSVEAVFDKAVELYGRVDIVSNNAGIQTDLPITRIENDLYDRIMDINLKGVFYFSKCAVARMKRQEPRGGNIVNTSSVTGIYGSSMGCPYPASKGGVITLGKSLAREVAGFNIRVNTVAPGVVDTNMVQNLGESSRAAVANAVPMGRMGTAEEVANAILFLASEEASYITGTCIEVHGGYTG